MKRLFFLLLSLVALVSATQVRAQGPTSVGTEFVFSFPTNYEDPGASQQYIRLSIAARTRTRVRVYTGAVLKTTLYTIPNDIVTLVLTKLEAQAVSRSTTMPVPNDSIYPNRAVRVVADEPISLSGLNRTSFTSDGMLVLPVSALGKEYVVASARDYLTGGYFRDLLPSQFLVAAAFDSTIVTITTPMATPNHTAGQTYSMTLDKGDVFSSMSYGPGGDLSGAVISATKPVAVMAGQNCAYLPDQRYPACDHLTEMMLPVESWGTVYHSVPFATRLKGDLYRIFASEPGTEVYINGTLRFELTGRGGAEGTGWAEYLPPTRELLEFTSNKPIMVAQYNNSQNYDGVVSDPFYLVLTPLEQYQTQTIFSTPTTGDFQENYLTIVVDSAGYPTIEISKTGTDEWENLAQKIPRAVRSFASTINGRRYSGITFDIMPGAYRIRGALPFAGYLYGFDSYDSYGYPMSVSADWLGSADASAPSITAALDSNGRGNGTASDLPDDAAIRSNIAAIELVGEASANYRLVVDEFEAGAASRVDFELLPVDSTLDARAVVMAIDKAGNASFDTLVYDAPALEPIVLATSHDFSRLILPDDSLANAEVTVANVGTASIRLVGIDSLAGDTAAFGFPDRAVFTNVMLDPGTTVTIPVTFRPKTEGVYEMRIFWGFNPAQPSVVSELHGQAAFASAAPDEDRTAAVAIESMAPNPAAEGAITIRYRAAGRAAELTLTGTDGTVLRRWREPAGSTASRIDLDGIASGTYLVRLVADGRSTVRTLVVVR